MLDRLGKFIIEPGRIYISGYICDFFSLTLLVPMAYGVMALLCDYGFMLHRVPMKWIVGVAAILFVANALLGGGRSSSYFQIKW